MCFCSVLVNLYVFAANFNYYKSKFVSNLKIVFKYRRCLSSEKQAFDLPYRQNWFLNLGREIVDVEGLATKILRHLL